MEEILKIWKMIQKIRKNQKIMLSRSQLPVNYYKLLESLLSSRKLRLTHEKTCSNILLVQQEQALLYIHTLLIYQKKQAGLS